MEIEKVPYCAGRLLMKLLFGSVVRVHVLGHENANRGGGFLLAANHISHFDPFIISLVIRRKIDWMTMAEFFRHPALGFLLRAIDAFPAERQRAELQTVRSAVMRLKSGRVVGLFPEGGIRDGARGLLEGGSLRPGAATLAHLAGVPIVPCVIVGSDRLYSLRRWLPLRRTPVWIAFGEPISHFPERQKTEARQRIADELAAGFTNLYAELREKFQLRPQDLPHPPRERMRHCRASASLAATRPGNRCGCPTIHQTGFGRLTASGIDGFLCASINLLHKRHRLNGQSRAEMECYLAQCERLTPQEYYAVPGGMDPFRSCPLDTGQTAKFLASEIAKGPRHNKRALPDAMGDSHMAILAWPSPIQTPFAANNIAHAEFFRCAEGFGAPTVFLLHSLMSTSRIGYRRLAMRFNALGWNACFVHLPYHYSRVPRGYWNGELAITPDLIRNAEALRQGVTEVRQLMRALRQRGCREFALLATSYGGWIGALLATVEHDFRFVALMSPIVNLEHAIWQSPAARFIRRELGRANIDPGLVARHFHLSSPLHTQPLCDPARVLFVMGEFDAIAPPGQIEAIHQKWRGSELLRVRQGHFGYRMLRETMARLKERSDV
jgi:1-acyl-sn-glycerol-3-phosphate acyltransferase